MAEYYINRNNNTLAPLIEDPNPSFNRMFFGGKAHDMSTLSPIWNKEFHFNYQDAFQLPDVDINTRTNGTLWLTKGTTNSWGTSDTQDADMQYQETYHFSLDPDFFPGVAGMWYSSFYNRIFWIYPIGGAMVNQSSEQAKRILVTPGDCTEPAALQFGSVGEGFTTFVYEDAPNNRLYGMRYTNSRTPGAAAISNYYAASGYTNSNLNSTFSACTKVFFIGVDSTSNTVTGNTYWLRAGDGQNSNYNIYRYHPVTLAETTVISNSNRPTQTTFNYYRSYPSNILRTTSTRRVFYSSHFDNTGVLAPIRYVFDSANGTVIANNCNIAYPGSLGYRNYANAYFGGSNPSGSDITNNRNSWHIKGQTFSNSGNNYVTFWLVDKSAMYGNGPSRWANNSVRTMMTYQIGPNQTNGVPGGDDYLTFHSAFTFENLSDMPKTFLPIPGSNGTSVVVGVENRLDFFNWNNVSGWSRTGVYPSPISMMGFDRLNRLWGMANEGAGQSGVSSIHLIGANTLPTSISVVMAANTYTYQGSNVYTSAAVNAYNVYGNRMVANVNLIIEGSTLVFQSSNTRSNTITTSASGDVTVPLVITGGGINNITANTFF